MITAGFEALPVELDDDVLPPVLRLQRDGLLLCDHLPASRLIRPVTHCQYYRYVRYYR